MFAKNSETEISNDSFCKEDNIGKVESSTKEMEVTKPILAKDIGTDYNYKLIFYWPRVITLVILHVLALWGVWMIITGQLMWKTLLWFMMVTIATLEGLTMGAHRLYTHRSFKAQALLRAILIIFQTFAGQDTMYKWVRRHRQHHRYSDTDADPHNAKRGFFFSHIGWLMCREHPMVSKMARTIDLSDLEADWMVMLQKRFYKTWYTIFAILIPVAVPVYYFGEDWLMSLMVVYIVRYVLTLNGTGLVNSAAHIYGTRPYDKNLQPVESWFVSLVSFGEGWHNYHHAYPWDYKAAELGMHFNFSATLIRWCESIGLASDLKVMPQELVEKRIARTGDGTHYKLGTDEGRATVTTPGGIFFHPLNPCFTSTRKDPEVALDSRGMPLSQEDPQALVDPKVPTPVPRRRHIGLVSI